MSAKILIRTIRIGTLLMLLSFLTACSDSTPSVQPLVCSEGQTSVIGSTRSFCLEFFQVDQEVDNEEELHSPLGMVELSFENEPELLHFNLRVNNIFRVRNIPIVSDDRDESTQTSVVFYFDLDNNSGTEVSQLQYSVDLTPQPLTTNVITTSAQIADVKPTTLDLFSGEGYGGNSSRCTS